MFPSVAYGLTDNLSISGGMSIIPALGLSEQLFYVAPRLGKQFSDRLAVATGVLWARGGEGDDDQLSAGFAMATFPEGADRAELRGCGTYRHPNNPETRPEDNLFQMHGPRIWRLALRHADEVLDAAFAQAEMARDDVDVIVPHQASGPMLDLFPKFGFADRKVVKVIAEYGNCIAASVPMALHEAVATGRLRRGQTALLFGTGAGLSMAAAIVRY